MLPYEPWHCDYCSVLNFRCDYVGYQTSETECINHMSKWYLDNCPYIFKVSSKHHFKALITYNKKASFYSLRYCNNLTFFSNQGKFIKNEMQFAKNDQKILNNKKIFFTVCDMCHKPCCERWKRVWQRGERNLQVFYRQPGKKAKLCYIFL